MITKPMRTLGLNYPMIQFLIRKTVDDFRIALFFCVIKSLRAKLFNSGRILGNPRATSRDDAIFSGESILQEVKSPWERTLTEPVPEVAEFRPADCP